MPDLNFRVVSAECLPYAASPTILFKLEIENKNPDEEVHSILLRSQIRIETMRRHYDSEAEERLIDFFGEPHRWGETLRSLLWTQSTAVVPQFTGNTIAELPITCTYDFEVAAAKYFYSLRDGEAPLLFLFSGTIFYHRDEKGLQIAQIPWSKEAQFRLPISLWREVMDSYFPNSSWLRLRQDIFDRLYLYKAKNGLPTWEEALDRLLGEDH